MRAGNRLIAEVRKTATLPATLAGVAVAVLGSAAVTALNAWTVRNAIAADRLDRVVDTSPVETAFAALPLGTVGAVIIGVTVISSEYRANRSDAGGGRQISATLTAVPRRAALLATKVATVVLLVAAIAAVTVPVSLGIAHAVIGAGGAETITGYEVVVRGLGGALYWTLTALMALAVTVLTRSGIIPLIVFIANSSLVSVSLLLTHLTPLAHWLPDLAGRRLFTGVQTVEGGLDVVPGALVMGGWSLALILIAGIVFARRDA